MATLTKDRPVQTPDTGFSPGKDTTTFTPALDKTGSQFNKPENGEVAPEKANPSTPWEHRKYSVVAMVFEARAIAEFLTAQGIDGLSTDIANGCIDSILRTLDVAQEILLDQEEAEMLGHFRKGKLPPEPKPVLEPEPTDTPRDKSFVSRRDEPAYRLNPYATALTLQDELDARLNQCDGILASLLDDGGYANLNDECMGNALGALSQFITESRALSQAGWTARTREAKRDVQ